MSSWIEVTGSEASRQARRYYAEMERDRLRQIAAPIRRKASKNFRFIRRKILRMNKSRVARACGVSRNTVRRWEDPQDNALPDVGHIGALFDGMTLTLLYNTAKICGHEEVSEDG